jgi:hypothetical protein
VEVEINISELSRACLLPVMKHERSGGRIHSGEKREGGWWQQHGQDSAAERRGLGMLSVVVHLSCWRGRQ